MKKIWVTIATLSLLSFLIVGSILFRIGPQSTFYTIDPDVPYFANALLFLTEGKIIFNSHPGTPTIMLLSCALFPIRLYAGLILHTPFLKLVFENMQATFHYLRYFQSILFSLSVSILLLAVYNSTRSRLSVVLAWVALFSFSMLPHFGTSIVPETLSLFFVSAWLLAFSLFDKARSWPTCLAMLVLSGLGLANKFTNLPLALASLGMVFTLENCDLKQKINKFIYASGVILITFAVFTWPVRYGYPQLFQWVKTLATTTAIQGGGKKAIFDLGSYLFSVKTLIKQELLPFYLIIATVAAAAYRSFLKKGKLVDPLNFLIGGAVVSIAISAKYYLSYYQLANYTLMVFAATLLFKKIPNVLKLTLVAIMVFTVISNVKIFYTNVLLSSRKVEVLEKYTDENPPHIAAVWQWGRVKNFAILWTRDWSGARVFVNELANYKPTLYELNPDFESVTLGNGEKKSLFDACWDQLYLLKASLDTFLSKNSEKISNYKILPGTDDMVYITSNHCLK
jgi:hypothetical protein